MSIEVSVQTMEGTLLHLARIILFILATNGNSRFIEEIQKVFVCCDFSPSLIISLTIHGCPVPSIAQVFSEDSFLPSSSILACMIEISTILILLSLCWKHTEHPLFSMSFRFLTVFLINKYHKYVRVECLTVKHHCTLTRVRIPRNILLE